MKFQYRRIESETVETKPTVGVASGENLQCRRVKILAKMIICQKLATSMLVRQRNGGGEHTIRIEMTLQSSQPGTVAAVGILANQSILTRRDVLARFRSMLTGRNRRFGTGTRGGTYQSSIDAAAMVADLNPVRRTLPHSSSRTGRSRLFLPATTRLCALRL
jgi:hypothetical protein